MHEQLSVDEAGVYCREARYEHTPNLPAILAELHTSLLISTYQAGKLVHVATHNGKLSFSFHHFDRPMGLAVGPRNVAVACRDQVWFLQNVREIAPSVEPIGQYDACLLSRSAHVTGDIQAHDIAWAGSELWVVNTTFSCLATLDPQYSFVPRWRPPFVTALAAEDRCHLNGLAVADGVPRFVTAMGETDARGAWRSEKVRGGCVIEVPSGRTIVRGLSMPHSPRWHQDSLWFLHSGRGRLVRVNHVGHHLETVVDLPGYTRGLCFAGPFAFLGLSRIRETATFGSVPIAEHHEQLKCGIAVVDLRSSRLVAHLEFTTGVEEIFDVTVLPDTLAAAVRGPFSSQEDEPAIWVVPDSTDAPRAVSRIATV